MNSALLEKFMQRAIDLARNGVFRACPNPATGAVLVKNSQIVSEGWHEKAGEAHAEIACLKNARAQGIDPAGCLIAVTLEPCVHQGKTPPCADALLAAKIGALAYGVADPNPLAKGGALKLKEKGITVFGPILEQKCQDLIADFTVWQKGARPYVILKLAMSLDGRIATANGDARWISSDESRQKVHELRALVGSAGGAVLIGGKTFRKDNPALTSRSGSVPVSRQPLACILTSSLPEKSAGDVLLNERPAETIFFTGAKEADSQKAKLLKETGCSVFAIPFSATGNADLQAALVILREKLHCPYVLCEGGGRIALSLLEKCLVDEFHLHIAPIVLGDANAMPLFSGRNLQSLKDALHLRICEYLHIGPDLILVLRPET